MANELTYQSVFTGQEMDERFTAVAQLQAALLGVETALSAKYVKPASGIPETDLDSAVQSALAKARSAVQDLSNYYTKTEIDSLLAAVNSQEYVDVATLPTASASTLGKIYLVGPTNNQYDRYYTSYDGSAYSWVAAGSTEINLANYATKAELNQLDQELNGGEPDIFGTLTFEQGGISTTNGSNQTSNQQVRSGFITTPSLRVTVTNGSVYVYGWNGDTYLSAIGWKTGTNDFAITGATKYKVVFKLPSGNLTPAGVGDLGASVYIPVRGQVVKCVIQTLNETEKQTARDNIGAAEDGVLDPFIFGGFAYKDISNVEEKSVYIYNESEYRPSNGSTNKSTSKFVPIEPGRQYKIDNPLSVESFYTVLYNIDNIGVEGGTPHWAAGYSARVAVAAGQSSIFTAPIDGHYIYLLCKNVYGNNYEMSLYENIEPLESFKASVNARITALETGIDELKTVFESVVMPVNADGYELPINAGMNYALKKAEQAANIKYIAKASYPTLDDPTGASAGEKTGFTYSSAKEMAKFIHWHVSERTFMTATNNVYGLFYTEDIAANNTRSGYGYTYHGANCGPYYGMVCNIFALWCLGYPVPFDTAQYAYLARKGVLVELNNQTAQGVHICDLVWYEGHTALVTAVKHDEFGNVTEVKITESLGHVHTTTFTATQFETYLHVTHNAILYRPTFVYDNTYQPSEFIGVRGEDTPSAYEYNDDICFFAGDYAAWKLGESAWVNYTKGSFTGMKVYKDNTLVDTITLDNDSSVHKVNVTSYINGAGKYKACLTDGVNDSDFTYWQMVEASASFVSGVLSFESANGVPWYVQICGANGGAYCWYELTAADRQRGNVALDFAAMIAEQFGPSAAQKYVRVAFRSDYGAVVSNMIATSF